jgi:alpha-N-arabinofuranosidase
VRYATMLRPVDPGAELVVCGQEDDWNIQLLAMIGQHLGLVDHLSIHRYWITGGAEAAFSAEQYYALLAEAEATEQFVQRTAAILQDAAGGKQRIGIALDEWGVWHPEARDWGPHDVPHRSPTTYEQAGTLRDALAAAIALEGFHRQCQVLTMANLAQVVNVLHAPLKQRRASGRFWLRGTKNDHSAALPEAHVLIGYLTSKQPQAKLLVYLIYQNPLILGGKLLARANILV